MYLENALITGSTMMSLRGTSKGTIAT